MVREGCSMFLFRAEAYVTDVLVELEDVVGKAESTI